MPRGSGACGAYKEPCMRYITASYVSIVGGSDVNKYRDTPDSLFVAPQTFRYYVLYLWLHDIVCGVT